MRLKYLLFGIFLLSFSTFGQNHASKKKLAIEIQRTIEKIHAVRAKHFLMKKRYEVEISRMKGQIESLQKELERSSSKIQIQNQSIKTLSKKIDEDQGKIKYFKDFISQVTKKGISDILGIKSQICEGILYQKKKREKQIEEILKRLKKTSFTLKIQGLTDFWSFVSEELRLGKSIQLWNETVLVEDGKRQKHAYQARLGLVNHFFISEDAKVFGIAERGNWRLKLDKEVKKQLQIIFAILQQQRVPQIIPIPFINRDSK